MDETTSENKIIEINPLTKWKRILAFLADFFLNFILSFILFNVLVAPIGKAIINFNDNNNQYIQNQKDMVEVFIGNDLLKSKFAVGDDSRYIFSNHMEETYEYWLSYYVLTDDNPDIKVRPNLGHVANNETIKHFFIDIRDNQDKFINHFISYNKVQNYFEMNNETIALKNENKDYLYSHFDPKNDYKLLKEGQEIFDNIYNTIFIPFYALMVEDVSQNNLTYLSKEGRMFNFLDSYNFNINFEKVHNNMLTICSFIAFALSFSIYFVIIPLVNKTRKTIGMMIMHNQIINAKSLCIVKRKPYILVIFYQLFFNLTSLMFMPLLLIGFNMLFNLGVLSTISMISFIFGIVSLIVLLASSLNQTLSDKLGGNVYVSDEALDYIYKEKGYDFYE